MGENQNLPIFYPVSELNPDGIALPTQQRFHFSTKKYRMLAGGWGTGKTTCLNLEMSKDIQIPNNYILMGRKDLQEFKSTFLKEFLDIYHTAIVGHNKQDRLITFRNGTEIYYTNLDANRDAIQKISSLNLGAVIVDQCEEIAQEMFTTFTGRLRRAGTRRMFYAGMNPNGHDWIWDLFVKEPYEVYLKNRNISLDVGHNIVEDIKRLASKKVFINRSAVLVSQKYNIPVVDIQNIYKKSTYEMFIAITLENVYLTDDFIQACLNLPADVIKRYFYCSFDDFVGLVYKEFVRSKNVINYYEPKKGDRHYLILDYGYTNPTAVLFAATRYDGKTIIYDEIFEKEELIGDVARAIKKRKYWNECFKLADPSIFNKGKDGSSISNDYATKHKIVFNEADNEIAQGINRVNTMFKTEQLLITENCINTIREVENYKFPDLKPGQQKNKNEKPIKRNDHTCDDIRYLANYIRIPEAIPPDPNNPDWLKEILKEQHNEEED